MAPTNLLRTARKTRSGIDQGGPRRRGEPREILIRAGTVALRARLRETSTADRIWAALPIYGTAETWGDAIHFETHVETGREADARARVAPGEIAYWTEDDRVMIAFGETPLSRSGEMRLPCPCNIWAVALDDVGALVAVRPGERVAVLVAES
ncbi:MAG: cyclophilin-like family protein [Hyphomicrobiaceae bacterium]|nr:cyclophilin-like family protein [Hyphomicrobiaceae bacterium]